METLFIESTDDKPKIILDKKNNIFEISGRSLPEDSVEFYKPVLEWLSAYALDSNEKTDFMVKLDYYNTSSSKFIQEILHILEKIKAVTIYWYYLEGDEDMEAAGQEFAEQINIPFVFRNL
jgi:hypothetical protein